MSRGRLLANAGLAAFVAVMLAGPGATIFPSTLRWASWAACPAGTAPAPKRFRASYSRPGETQIALVCVAPDGTVDEHTLAAMGGLWLMYFAGGFVVLSLLSLRGGGSSGGSRPVSAGAPPLRAVPPEIEAQARELIARDQTITAIKIAREASGMGLKEAKDWVEALPGRPPTAPGSPSPESAESPSEKIGRAEAHARRRADHKCGLRDEEAGDHRISIADKCMES
jgi:hypothetical protein